MALLGGHHQPWLILRGIVLMALVFYVADCENIYLEWHVATNDTIRPVYADQPVRLALMRSILFFLFIFFGS